MVTGDGVTVLGHQIPTRHIYEHLGWRYGRRLPVSTSDSTSDDPTTTTTTQATGLHPNNIDRAVWPANYVHRGDVRLRYNDAGNV